MNELRALDRLLVDERYRLENEIHVDPEIGKRALAPLDRMLAFQQLISEVPLEDEEIETLRTLIDERRKERGDD